MGMMERFASLAAGGPITDPQFNAVTMLLRGNGVNGSQNNTFLDSGTANGGIGFPITRNPASGPNAITQGTFSPFSNGGWSGYFDGASGHVIDLPATANASVGAIAGTQIAIECWIYVPEIRAVTAFDMAIFGNFPSTAANARYFIALMGTSATSDPNVRFAYSTGTGSFNTCDTTGTVALGRWNHIAVTVDATTASSSTVRIFINGVGQTFTGQNLSTHTADPGITFSIGSTRDTVNYQTFNGYMSNFRFVRGALVYTSNFTPPTAPLGTTTGGQTPPTGTQTRVLVLQSSRFVDVSSNAFALVLSGTPSIQAFSPFSPTAAYNAATNGGSGYFDGTGDSLSIGANAANLPGAGDYTFEAWVYTPAVTALQTIVSYGATGSTFRFFLNAANPWLLIGSTSISQPTGNSLTANTWMHIVVVRSGSGTNNTAIYVNGNRIAQVTNTSNFNAGNPSFGIEGTSVFTGYMSNVRLVTQALYNPANASIPIPTAPFTNVSNTAYLLNFTNAGVIDAAGRHVIETNGTAIVASGTYQPTATGSNGANTITVSSATNLKLGQSVAGTGIAPGAYVTGISGTTITLSANNVSAVSGTVVFVDPTKWGNGSFYFPGASSSAALFVRDTQLMKVTSLAFTYETWAFAITNQTMLFQFQSNSNGFSAIRLQATGTNQYTLYMSANGSTWPVQTQSTGTFPLYQWVHVAVNRDGSNITVFVNGDVFISASVSITTMSDTTNIIGNIWSGGTLASSSWYGYMEDFRTTLGVARYAVGTGANANKMVFKGTNILALPQSQFPVQ